MPGLWETNGTADHDQVYAITVEKNKTQIEEEERILLKRLAQEDSTAFWRLWERYRDYLYGCSLRWMGGNRSHTSRVEQWTEK